MVVDSFLYGSELQLLEIFVKRFGREKDGWFQGITDRKRLARGASKVNGT